MLDTNTICARLYCQLSRPKLQLRLFARKWLFGLKLAKKVQPGPERKKKTILYIKKVYAWLLYSVITISLGNH